MPAMTRRGLGGACLAAGAMLALPGRADAATARTVGLADGTSVPALGQGSWHLGQGRRPPAEERAAMAAGLDLGLTVLDTAELYGDGKAEELIRQVIAGRRDQTFLVSKVRPEHASAAGIRKACTASLARLGTDRLDLYLLHWRTSAVRLPEVVEAFEALRTEGRIRRWGVSNFGVADMEALRRVPGGERCAANQVEYSLSERRIERDLLPWCAAHRVPIMAYTPLGGRGSDLMHHPEVVQIAAAHATSPAAVALAWTLRGGNAIAIPESGSAAHVRENAAALSLDLSPEDLRRLDQAFPA